MDHVGHCLPVHGVQRLVDLVKEVEGSWVAFLNRKCLKIKDKDKGKDKIMKVLPFV